MPITKSVMKVDPSKCNSIIIGSSPNIFALGQVASVNSFSLRSGIT